jgi:putative SOS response-associated peptidase YedK
MCGRFTLRTPGRVLADLFRLAEPPPVSPRYNIAPTQPVLAVHLDDQRRRGWATLRWGLVPHWAADPKVGARNVNARAESVAEKLTFRGAFRHRRCLIPADGFYEWYGPQGKKRAFFFHLKDERPFAFAGLWEHWQRDDRQVDSCTVLTTEANSLGEWIHDRMPLILEPERFDLWLDEGADPKRLQALLTPLPGERMAMREVGPRVNNARNEGPGCLAPADAAEGNLFDPSEAGEVADMD